MKKDNQLKSAEKLISDTVGKEFGSFIITGYDGYYCKDSSGYSRHYFIKTCKFCNNTKIQKKSSLNTHTLCNTCCETYNVNTNQKKCSCCNTWFDATDKFFNKSKNQTDLSFSYFQQIG